CWSGPACPPLPIPPARCARSRVSRVTRAAHRIPLPPIVRVDIKFCGLTRSEDALAGASLGAGYLGVIFAGGPRQLTAERAAEVLRAARPSRRVGVFGSADPDAIARVAAAAALDVVQLHGDPDAAALDAVRRVFPGAVWAVLRITGAELPAGGAEL